MYTNPRARSARTRRHHGFTLIELLVVISIIAMLISILLPSLKTAREQARQTVCLAHISNLGSSLRVYESDDPQGWGIPVHPKQYDQEPNAPSFIGAYEWGGKSGMGSPGYVDGPAAGEFAWITSKYGTKAGFGPATRPLNAILFTGGFTDALVDGYDRFQGELDTKLDLDIFHCPADKGPPRGAHCRDWLDHSERSSYDHFGNSYAANVFMIAPGSGGEMESNSPYMRPTTRVPTPARTLYLEENIGRWAWACRREIDDCTWIGPGVDPGPTKALTGWHGKDWTFNRAFVDAHAETQRIYNEGTEDADGYATHYRNERVFPDDAEQNAQRCIIVRGNGWQKDTLPAPTVRTGLMHNGNGRPSYEGCVN